MTNRFFHRKKSRGQHPAPLLVPAAHSAGQLTLPVPAAPRQEWPLYDALRCTVPVVDAALRKIVRLSGGFRLTADDPAAQALLDAFAADVPVNGAGSSLQLFADQILDSLLTYGNAVGEMLTDEDGIPAALMTAHPRVLLLEPEPDGSCRMLRCAGDGKPVPLRNPERILFAALDPPAGSACGVSVLRGLPAVADILLRIYDCIGKNYTRAGNVRYAVTYQPDGDAAAFAKDHAKEIAEAWRDGIRAAEYGEVQDFVAVGHVDIKVIGAENQLFDTNIPVRQLLEQIVSKLSIPPFLLGFSWSTTERMSAQQADILTSELEYFRRILTPLLRKIGTAVLRGAGFDLVPQVEWENINLQDETELAEARLKNAQAAEIELRLRTEEVSRRDD
ncbi:MAG: serine/threonine protein phosphatase [Oscillospiraceae bacterium]|nr:serine/threonine protein phosphatase [Oscillospiraceae bacterium]